MSEQSEFEKYKNKCWEESIYKDGLYSTGIMVGMSKARDWVLRRAKDLVICDFIEDCEFEYIRPKDLEETCK